MHRGQNGRRRKGTKLNEGVHGATIQRTQNCFVKDLLVVYTAFEAYTPALIRHQYARTRNL